MLAEKTLRTTEDLFQQSLHEYSRTNRVLNDTKPYGHILDFRGQQDAVDAAIALFSGAKADKAREIWLVDKASSFSDSVVILVSKANRLSAIFSCSRTWGCGSGILLKSW